MQEEKESVVMCNIKNLGFRRRNRVASMVVVVGGRFVVGEIVLTAKDTVEISR